QGSRITPYAVVVRVRPFSEPEWERIIESLSSQVGHLAALLDGELLPGAGEVQPRCSCPDWADPCKHSAAVIYLVADLLDEDPFQLFLLRGRGRDELLASLRAQRASAARGAGAAGGA